MEERGRRKKGDRKGVGKETEVPRYGEEGIGRKRRRRSKSRKQTGSEGEITREKEGLGNP